MLKAGSSSGVTNKPVRLSLAVRVLLLYLAIIAVIGGYWLWHYQQTQALNGAREVEASVISAQTLIDAHKQQASQITDGGRVQRLVIPRIGVALDVIPGVYDVKTKTWNVAKDKAQQATNTSNPNNIRSNTLIYGHNTEIVLAKTRNLRSGDIIYLETDQHLRFVYSYDHDDHVPPTDTSFFANDAKRPRLTLLTCNGWLSEQRRLMFFSLVGVSKV